MLRVSRDLNRSEVDWATGKLATQNDGRAFVATRVAENPVHIYELTVSAGDVRMLWPARSRAQRKVRSDEDTPLVTAIKARIANGVHPGINEQWKPFCDNVRRDSGVGEYDRGCSDRSIQRIVNDLNDK